jgi:hypothetical protein
MRTRTVRFHIPTDIWFVRCNSCIRAAVPRWHPMLHYHLLHFTVLRVPFGYVRDRLVFYHSIRYRLHFSDIGYVFQISVTFSDIGYVLQISVTFSDIGYDFKKSSSFSVSISSLCSSSCLWLGVNDLHFSNVSRVRQPFGTLLYALSTTDIGVVMTLLLQLLVKEQSFPSAISFHGLNNIALVCCAESGPDDVPA